MAKTRGKKTAPETIFAIMAVWSITNNYAETAKRLNIPEKTVEKIVKENKDKDEFAELCGNTRKDFATRATGIIDKAVTLLEKRFDRALEEENELDMLIDEIWDSDKEELSREERNKLVNKIRSLQLYDITAVSKTLATLYDKRALARGEATESIHIVEEGKLDKLAKLAGYKKDVKKR